MKKNNSLLLRGIEEFYSRRGIKPGLGTIRALLREFRISSFPFQVIHVAGSNGKGTTATAAARILENCGKKTGLYVSPHLIRVNERISIGGKDISDKEFLKYTKRIRETLHRKNKKLLAEVTFFEFMTLMSILYFIDEKVEWAVYEAGMGGRLDATNVFPSKACVITDICREHTEYLGGTEEKIAREKFAIVKPGSSVVTYAGKELVEKTLRFLRIKNKRISRLGDDFSVKRKKIKGFEQSFHYTDRGENMDCGYVIPTPVKVQGKNTAAAVKAAWEALGKYIPRKDFITACRRALARLSVPGRFEIIKKDPYVIADVCHNGPGVKELVNSILASGMPRKWCVIFGALKDKDYRKMFSHLKKISRDFIFVRPESERAVPPDELLGAVSAQKGKCVVTVIEDIKDALQFRKSHRTGKNCLICGSFYVAGPALKCFRRSRSL